jgi:antitoxin component YwqK of YwqJK toxin-antitoxin module
VFGDAEQIDLVMYPIARKIDEYEIAATRHAEAPYDASGLWLSSAHWHDSGQLAGITVFFRGTHRSVSILFHDNGVQSLYKEEEFGKGNGLIRWWHRNGVLRGTGQERDGHPDGTHEFWDEFGNFNKQLVWDMGTLKSETEAPPK